MVQHGRRRSPPNVWMVRCDFPDPEIRNGYDFALIATRHGIDHFHVPDADRSCVKFYAAGGLDDDDVQASTSSAAGTTLKASRGRPACIPRFLTAFRSIRKAASVSWMGLAFMTPFQLR